MILIGMIHERTATVHIPWYLLHGTLNKASCFKLLHKRGTEVDLRAINFYESMEAVHKELVETY